MIAYVAQPNGYGCTIACCAMIIGKSYEAMEEWLLAQRLPRSRMELGLHEYIYLHALGSHGFAFRQQYRTNPYVNREEREQWPLAPFAPVHICTVDVTSGHHAIVMLADGTIHDPFKRERTTIDHPDYRQIDQMIGIWKVA